MDVIQDVFESEFRAHRISSLLTFAAWLVDRVEQSGTRLTLGRQPYLITEIALPQMATGDCWMGVCMVDSQPNDKLLTHCTPVDSVLGHNIVVHSTCRSSVGIAKTVNVAKYVTGIPRCDRGFSPSTGVSCSTPCARVVGGPETLTPQDPKRVRSKESKNLRRG
eukprot:586925-Amphidinium_carterae.1